MQQQQPAHTLEGAWAAPWMYAGGTATAGLMITYWATRVPRRVPRLQLGHGAIV